MTVLLVIVAAAAGAALGYVVCYLGTWARVHRQEAYLRAMITDINVLMDMDDEVPTQWVLNNLESILAKEFG
jgi:hypothetical protein